MPRFLATDYLRDAVKIRQALMNRMLVVLPAHLECTETYPHRCVNDSLYRTPWKRAQNKDKVVQFNEADIAEDLNKLCCQDFTGVIQSCNSFTRDIQALEEEDILEIIPSSNPDSPRLSSHQLQEIQQQTQQLSTQELLPFKEVFDKRDVSVLMKNLEYGGMLFFEELIEDINMRQYLHNIPTLSQLCERLPAQTVCDPLVDKNGKPFKEKEVCRLNEELLKNDKPEEKEHCKESFVKADICPNQDGFLDESLIGDSAAVSLTMEQMPSTQKLQDILRLTQEDVDKDISHCSQDFSVLVQTCNSDSTMDQSTRLSAISPVEDGQIDDFVQLNSQGLNRSPGKTDKVKAAILESPMEDDNHIIHQTLSQMIKKLEPCEVSPCQTQTILSSNEKKEEENKLWQQEKYLSEITRLTLQEPSCTKEATIEDSTISVIKELGLQGEDIECDLELQLPWDPLSASTKEITHHRKLLDTLSLGQQDMVEDREIYVKYETQLFLYDWQEQTLVAENRYEKGERGEEMVEATSHAEQNATEEKIPILSKQSDGTEAMVTQDGFTSLQLHTIDPLDNFMMLRQGIVKRSPILPKKNQSPAGKPRAVLKTPEIRQCLDKQASPCSNTSITSTPKRDSLKKNKSRVVTVKMPDEFNDLVSLFESACKEAIMILRHQNAISASYTFSSLTPDVTRFLLKQQEKLMGQNNQGREREIYKCVLILHTLVTAADVMVHCSLSSAVNHINIMQDQYQDLLTESLASIQRQLFKQQFVFHERQVIHPKLTELGHQIGEWFYRKMQKGDGDQDPKILVIVRRDFDGLSPIIVKTLENIKGIHTGIAELPTMNCLSYDEITQTLDQNNCVIVDNHCIGEEFPWNHFSLVIEYEYHQQSPLQQLCIRQNIRHIALQSVPIESIGIKSVSIDADSQPIRAQIKPVRDQHTLIASKKLTSNTELLQLLESRHDIMIIERNYDDLVHFYQSHSNLSRPPYFADVIIDERTCIILQELTDLSHEGSVQPLISQVIAFSVKYNLCWVILHVQTTHKSKYRYPFSGHVTSNISYLNASVAHFSNKIDGYEVKIVYSYSTSDTARIIREISEDSLATTTVWDKQDWITRTWLTQEISNHERFLLSFGCMNSFSAQVMLTACPLQRLMSCPLQELINVCPWIPQKMIKQFHHTIHYKEDIPMTDISPHYQKPIELMFSQESCDVEMSMDYPESTVCRQTDIFEILEDSAADDQIYGNIPEHQTLTDEDVYCKFSEDTQRYISQWNDSNKKQALDFDDCNKVDKFKLYHQSESAVDFYHANLPENGDSVKFKGDQFSYHGHSKAGDVMNKACNNFEQRRDNRGVQLQCVPPTPRTHKPVYIAEPTPSLGYGAELLDRPQLYKPHVGIAQPFMHVPQACDVNIRMKMWNQVRSDDGTLRDKKMSPVSLTEKADQRVPNNNNSAVYSEVTDTVDEFSLFTSQEHRVLTASKRRRLMYEKVPGMKGQTRLSFF